MRIEIRQLLERLLTAEFSRTTPPFVRETSKSAARLRYATQIDGRQFVLDIVYRDCDEAFSADLIWGGEAVSQASLDPADLLGSPSGSIRVDLLWSNGGHWWTISPPPAPTITRRSARDIFRQSSHRITLERAAGEMPGLVRDFATRVVQYVIPYMRLVVSHR